MKRILVIDESEVVRETLALILGRRFVVLQRPLGAGELSLADTGGDIDLLILGVTPSLGGETSRLLEVAAQAPCAVLFLVDSKSAARAMENRERIGCLVKPFNPYALLDKVEQLLARYALSHHALTLPSVAEKLEDNHYLEYPYLGRAAASLVPRFAITRLPILICGEIGCGQERVARAIDNLQGGQSRRITINAAEISADYLAQKNVEFRSRRGAKETPTTLLIENLDTGLPSAQSLLLDFLERAEEAFGGLRLLTTSRADLLEKLYQREFLEALYYKLATLTLKLPPLRDRREDIPAIAARCARFFAHTLGLGEVTFSAAADQRLSNYLWFGNVNEMETVIARTLAAHRKTRVEAADLVFDFSPDTQLPASPNIEESDSTESRKKEDLKPVPTESAGHNGSASVSARGDGRAQAIELKVVIHELAHELKNPMVTIKTFAQLLGDRYEDENFRTRFQDVVGNDIERMDDLLESMIEFADFSQPRWSNVALEEKLRSTLQEMNSECTKRQARIRWKGNGYNREVRADEAQLAYVLKNMLLAILAQTRVGSEIEIDVEKRGSVSISYSREGPRVTAITHYFHPSTTGSGDGLLPLRLLLAKQLVERNGGRMAIDSSDSERDILKMELPLA